MAVNHAGLSPVAVVVSLFNPPPQVVERCAGWVQSIGPVFAVDDGSPDPAVHRVLDALVAHGVTVLVNHRNEGIARALNVGISRALRDVAPAWILTMDQDSELGDGYLAAAQATLATARRKDRVGMLCAEWIGDLRAPTIRSRGVVEVREPIQSGMLMRVSMLRQLGLFDESLFIDAVDTDFVARARQRRWSAVPIVGGHLHHALGQTVPVTVRGRPLTWRGRQRHITYHPPLRSYYTARNQLHLAGRYAFRCPGVPLRTYATQATILASLAAFARDRRLQCTALGLGVRDALLARYGSIGIGASRALGLPEPGANPAPGAVPRNFERQPVVAQILLSTWNGQEYVAELLESLLRQETQAQVRILVRDDGSTDDTLTVLDGFAERDPRITVVRGENRGVDRSFHALMQMADPDADLYFFCDQDDVWFTDKVQAAVEALSDQLGLSDASGGPRPALYCSRSMVTDSSLEPIGPTRDYERASLAHALVMNIAPGHTMALTAPLLRLVRDHFDPDKIMVFDHWIYLVAAGLGSVVFDHTWHTWYRNHDSNAIGYSVKDSWSTRIAAVREADFGAYTRQAAQFERDFGSQLHGRRAARLRGFVHQGSLLSRLRYVRRFGIEHGSTLASVSAAVLFIVGSYRP
ncbi:Rhamnosyltransferase, Glycosyl transferase family 2 [Propionibacterium freudenreichii]|nr:Rhamnosyltransferase, Glycosyl transferase family 2 [Propionibacterium freudenreichii]